MLGHFIKPFFFLLISISVLFPKPVQAAPACGISATLPANVNGNVTLSVTSSPLAAGSYYVAVKDPTSSNGYYISQRGPLPTYNFSAPIGNWKTGVTYPVYFFTPDTCNPLCPGGPNWGQALCIGQLPFNLTASQPDCSITVPPAPIDQNTSIVISVANITSGTYNIEVVPQSPAPSGLGRTFSGNTLPASNLDLGTYTAGSPSYTYQIRILQGGNLQCSTAFAVAPTGSGGGGPVGGAFTPAGPSNTGSKLPSGGITCMVPPSGSNPGYSGVDTAIGCVPTDPPVLVGRLVTMASFVGGGIALLLMVFGAFQMITSAGNPEGVKHGQEQFVAAIIGLIFILLAVSLMRIVGVDILDIPGFG